MRTGSRPWPICARARSSGNTNGATTAYLSDEALQTTGSSLLWWLARHTDNVEGAVERINRLDRLSAVAQGRPDPGPASRPDPSPVSVSAERGAPDSPYGDLDMATRLLNDLYPDPDDPLREMFVRDLARAAEIADRRSFGTQLRARFDVPDLNDEPFQNHDEGYDAAEASDHSAAGEEEDLAQSASTPPA